MILNYKNISSVSVLSAIWTSVVFKTEVYTTVYLHTNKEHSFVKKLLNGTQQTNSWPNAQPIIFLP